MNTINLKFQGSHLSQTSVPQLMAPMVRTRRYNIPYDIPGHSTNFTDFFMTLEKARATMTVIFKKWESPKRPIPSDEQMLENGIRFFTDKSGALGCRRSDECPAFDPSLNVGTITKETYLGEI